MSATGEDGRPPDAAEADVPFEDAADLLRALAHPVRLRIVDLLQNGELCVKRLEELLGVSQSSVSQHLSRLRYAGLIESERRGHLVCYRLAGSRATSVLGAVAEGAAPGEEAPRERAVTSAGESKKPDGETARPSDG
jgi:DNA-binding transcriptional ArsR family regulator